MSFADLLNQECTILRSTVTDTHGVDTKSWEEHATGVRCSTQSKAGKIESTKVGEYHEYTAIGFFLAGQDIKPQGGDDQPDVIKMTSPAAISGVHYKVLHVGDESGRGHHLVAYLKRVPDPAP